MRRHVLEKKQLTWNFKIDLRVPRFESVGHRGRPRLARIRATSATDVTRVILIEGTIARDTPVREEEKARNRSAHGLFGPFSNGLCDRVEHARH